MGFLRQNLQKGFSEDSLSVAPCWLKKVGLNVRETNVAFEDCTLPEVEGRTGYFKIPGRYQGQLGYVDWELKGLPGGYRPRWEPFPTPSMPSSPSSSFHGLSLKYAMRVSSEINASLTASTLYALPKWGSIPRRLHLIAGEESLKTSGWIYSWTNGSNLLGWEVYVWDPEVAAEGVDVLEATNPNPNPNPNPNLSGMGIEALWGSYSGLDERSRTDLMRLELLRRYGGWSVAEGVYSSGEDRSGIDSLDRMLSHWIGASESRESGGFYLEEMMKGSSEEARVGGQRLIGARIGHPLLQRSLQCAASTDSAEIDSFLYDILSCGLMGSLPGEYTFLSIERIELHVLDANRQHVEAHVSSPSFSIEDGTVTKPPSRIPIPRIAHIIWLGDEPPPSFVSSWTIEFISANPSWRVWLWREESLALLPMSCRSCFTEARDHREASDIARLEILSQWGGVFIDADSIWLGRPHDTRLEIASLTLTLKP